MNKVFMTGNVASDVKAGATNNGVPFARFRIAVQRRFRGADGQRETDFFSCECWRGTAEYAGKYINKGDKVGVVGSVQNSTYPKDGVNVTVTNIVVDELEILKNAHAPEEQTQHAEPQFTPVEDDDLPFD